MWRDITNLVVLDLNLGLWGAYHTNGGIFPHGTQDRERILLFTSSAVCFLKIVFLPFFRRRNLSELYHLKRSIKFRNANKGEERRAGAWDVVCCMLWLDCLLETWRNLSSFSLLCIMMLFFVTGSLCMKMILGVLHYAVFHTYSIWLLL